MTPANGFSGAYQRAGPLVNAAALLREFGVAPAEVTQGLDIDLDTVTADTRVSFPACLELLDRAAERTGCSHFGLLLGARYSWDSHGVIYRLARDAPTLRQALLDWVTWQLGYSTGAVVYLYKSGQDSQPSPHFLFCDSKVVGLYAKSSRHLQREAGPADRVTPRVK